MDTRNYIKVAEFARLAGVSRQSIYNDLTDKLTKFVKVIDNVKCIDIEALSLYTVKESVKLDSQFTTQLDNDLTAFLQRQIEEKDKQIERLQQALDNAREKENQKDLLIKENNEHIREQEKRLAELLAQAQQLNYNNQILLKEKNKTSFFKRLFPPRDNKDK